MNHENQNFDQLADKLRESFDLPIEAKSVEDGVLFLERYFDDDANLTHDCEVALSVLWDDDSFGYVLGHSNQYRGRRGLPRLAFDTVEDAVDFVLSCGVI